MPDTDRTLAALLALLADNSSGDISAQDLRDVVQSLSIKHGEIYISSSAATTITDTTSYFPIAGTWTLGEAEQFDEPNNGELRYTGTPTIRALIIATASINAADTSQTVSMRVEVNEANIIGSQATQSQVGTAILDYTVLGIVEMSTNDSIRVSVRNQTSTANVTATEGHLLVEAFTV